MSKPQSKQSKEHKRVPCTCVSLGCGNRTYTDAAGNILSGKLIPVSTRTYHRKKDDNLKAAALEAVGTAMDSQIFLSHLSARQMLK